MRYLMAILVAFSLQSAICAAGDWELVKPDGLGFEVEFPGKSEFTEQQGDDGGKIRTYAVKSSAAAYDLTVWDLPEGEVGPDDVARVLDNVRDGTLKSISAKLRDEAKIEISGQPARNVTADVMGMVWRGRIVIAGNRLYQLVAIISKSAETSPETERYMNSFKLHGGTAKK